MSKLVTVYSLIEQQRKVFENIYYTGHFECIFHVEGGHVISGLLVKGYNSCGFILMLDHQFVGKREHLNKYHAQEVDLTEINKIPMLKFLNVKRDNPLPKIQKSKIG